MTVSALRHVAILGHIHGEDNSNFEFFPISDKTNRLDLRGDGDLFYPGVPTNSMGRGGGGGPGDLFYPGDPRRSSPMLM